MLSGRIAQILGQQSPSTAPPPLGHRPSATVLPSPPLDRRPATANHAAKSALEEAQAEAEAEAEAEAAEAAPPPDLGEAASWLAAVSSGAEAGPLALRREIRRRG